jgi:hypothetical protein
MTPPYSMLQLPCCCIAGDDGGDPCYPDGICYSATFSQDSASGPPAVASLGYSGGAVSDIANMYASLQYSDAIEQWTGQLTESYTIAEFSIGISNFDAIQRNVTWDLKLLRPGGNGQTALVVDGIGAGNYYERIDSNNDDGYIEISKSSLFSLNNRLCYVSFDLSACPILPVGDNATFSIFVRKRYYRPFVGGAYVTDSLPVAWTWSSQSFRTGSLGVC